MRRRVSTSRFAQTLAELRKHLRNCPQCRLVTKAIVFGSMCNEGIALTHQLAHQSIRLETLHRKAYADPSKYIYACPDRMKHGEDYARTAEPHLNVAVQMELF